MQDLKSWPPVLHVWLPAGVQHLNLIMCLDCPDLTSDLDPAQWNDTRSSERYSAVDNQDTMEQPWTARRAYVYRIVQRYSLWLLNIAVDSDSVSCLL